MKGWWCWTAGCNRFLRVLGTTCHPVRHDETMICPRLRWESATASGGRPGACSLIEGRMKDIMPFLDRLTYGDNIPPDVQRTRDRSRKNRLQTTHNCRRIGVSQSFRLCVGYYTVLAGYEIL